MVDVDPPYQVKGRYELYDEIGRGGMAAVFLARAIGTAGISTIVAVKSVHKHLAEEKGAIVMLADEARLISRIRHSSVVSLLDVVETAGELHLVMEYIHGESLAKLMCERDRGPLTPALAAAVVASALEGLHAAHEAKGVDGTHLRIVHRDFSPHNVLVGVDGVARVTDFGVAKAVGRLQTTHDGFIKGKPAYMAPEQLTGRPIDRRADIFAAGVVLWETLTGRELHAAEDLAGVLGNVLYGEFEPPSRLNPQVPLALDAVVLRALARKAGQRYQTAREMAVAIEEAITPAPAREVGKWVTTLMTDSLSIREQRIAQIESRNAAGFPTFSPPPSDQDTQLSIDTPMGNEVPVADRRRVRVVLIASAVVAWVGVGVTATAIVMRTPSEPVLSAVSVSASTGAASSHAPVLPPKPAVSMPSPESSDAGQPPEASSPFTSKTRPVRRTALPSTTAAPRANCDPPYRLDGDGIKIPKPECL